MAKVLVNARIQKWMLDELKRRGEVGIMLEYILIEAGFKYHGPLTEKSKGDL